MRQHRDDLIDLRSESGLLLWCSGQAIDLASSDLEGSLVKPISRKHIVSKWNQHWEKLWSQPPVIDNISEDYDHDKVKVAKALDLLSREWKSMLSALSHAFDQGDQSEARKVYHRLTTTLKRLELYLQDQQIGQWLEDFQDEGRNELRANIIQVLENSVSKYMEDYKV